MVERSTASRRDGAAGASAVVSRASRPWRRQLGALAWVALEELALTARRDDQGWASPAGVHTVATGIGATDVSVLGALAALARAGLVSLEPLTDGDGRRRCGYRLHLPEGIALSDRLADEDAACAVLLPCPKDTDADHRHHDHRCPTAEHDTFPDGPLPPDHQYGGHSAEERR